jgi:hypothetical protein
MPPETRQPWSAEENAPTVASYLDMLAAELRGHDYVKADYWRALQRLIPARSKGAIEFKYGNISAVLRDLRFPPIDGYKPYSNYQAELFDEVERQLMHRSDLLALVSTQVDQPATLPAFDDILGTLVQRPKPPTDKPGRPRTAWYEMPRRTPPGIDYLQREARNTSLGAAGEAFVLAFEQARLVAAGRDRLASRVEQVSLTRGPAAGFDILSFDDAGSERLIEVKTTRYGRYTPFFVTRNEVLTSDSYASQYAVYRVFAFERARRLFVLPGAVRASCTLDPTEYEASL